MRPTLSLLALLLASLAALHAAEFPVLLDAPSWKARAGLVPEARRPAAFEVSRPYPDVLALASADAAGKSISTSLVTTPDANRFPGQARTVWTLYNARPNTVRGEVLAVPHHEGATYRDEWNDKELQPALRDGQAILSLELGPQSIGCISQTLRKP